MKHATRKGDTPALGHESLHSRLREILLIVFASLTVFFFMAFYTYHASDSGWSNTGTSSTIVNAGGRVGAWCADFFLYLFGYLAYLFPLIFGYVTWAIFQGRLHKAVLRPVMIILRGVGLLLFLLSGCAITQLLLPHFHAHLPYQSGGILGDVVAPGLVSVFNVVGALLVSLAMLLIGTLLFTGLSWLSLLERIGKAACSLIQWVITCFKKKPLSEKRLTPEVTVPTRLPDVSRIEPQITRNEPAKVTAFSVTKAASEKVAKPAVKREFEGELPSLSLLDTPDERRAAAAYSDKKLEEMSREVELRLKDFGVEANVVNVQPGPVITRFELQLAPGIKVAKLSSLAKDLARALSVVRVRVVDVIPGKTVVGLEVPNEHREIVRLQEVLSSEQYIHAKSPLSLALGKDIAGNPVIVDLGKMPHLLVAGTTGAGKSVGLNAMLLSMLFKAQPEEVRLVMVDPKMLELSIYEGIPHLLCPVVTDMKEAANVLRWCVAEMERRYRLMATLGVRSLQGYNTKIKEAADAGSPILNPFANPEEHPETPEELATLPYIVVLIDEFADMIMVVGKKIEELIVRIAQKARAAGIHLILATQRPSVDVITGLIKANIPTRIAFQVSQRVDSRTILDQQGAEQLLGHGDMLYLAPGAGVPVRVHGAFVADHEVHHVVEDWKQRGEPNYNQDIFATLDGGDEGSEGGVFSDGEESSGEKDLLYDQAVRIVTETRRASISGVQRRLKIGYNRAARMIEEMESAGVVGPMESNGSREVLANPPPRDA